jgi:hypothetical protein
MLSVRLLLAVTTSAIFATLFCSLPAVAQSPVPSFTTSEATHLPFTNGSIILKVGNFTEARTNLLQIAEREKAQVVDGKTTVTENGRRHGWVSFQVPAERLSVFVAAVREQGVLYADKLGSADQISEYESLGRRVTILKAHRDRLASILGSNRRLRGNDILYLQERIFRAEVDASLLEQRQEDMRRRSSVSLVTVSLFEPISLRKVDQARLDLSTHFAMAKTNANAAFSRFLGRVVTVGAYALAFAPVWVPLLIGAVLLIAIVVRYLQKSRFFERVGEFLQMVVRRFRGVAQWVAETLSRSREPVGKKAE